MALDVLIAVSARRWRATVVTENYDDFKTIQRYCNTKIAKASDFFQRSDYFPNREPLNVTSALAQAFLKRASTNAASSFLFCAFKACIRPYSAQPFSRLRFRSSQ